MALSSEVEALELLEYQQSRTLAAENGSMLLWRCLQSHCSPSAQRIPPSPAGRGKRYLIIKGREICRDRVATFKSSVQINVESLMKHAWPNSRQQAHQGSTGGGSSSSALLLDSLRIQLADSVCSRDKGAVHRPLNIGIQLVLPLFPHAGVYAPHLTSANSVKLRNTGR